MNKKSILIIICLILVIICGIYFYKYNTKNNSNNKTEITNENVKNENTESTGVSDMRLKTSENVRISCDISNLNDEQIEVLNTYLEFQQAMIDKNIDKLDELSTDNKTFTHMSGKTQTKSEYFGEIKDGTLNYYKSELVELSSIEIDGDTATMRGRTALTAKVYGASGTWTLSSGGHFKKINGKWYESNR